MESDPLRARRRVGLLVIGGASVVWLASLIVILTVSPTGMQVSSDPGVNPVAHWVVLLPSAVGIALVLVLPPKSPRRPVVLDKRRPFITTTISLIALAALFPIAVASVPLEGEFYVLAKLLLFMIVPGVLLAIFRHSVKISWSKSASRWWAPAIVIAAWTALSQIAPWNPTFDLSDYDPLFIVVAATATALTAGVGEELFYRRWLQTRLEVAIGAWPGIALASLAFGLMHLGSHGTGEPVIDVAQVIVAQGTFGLFLGIMWWRYRNLLAIILVHIIANGWGVAAALLSQ